MSTSSSSSSASNANLDLTNVETTDYDKIQREINDFYLDDSHSKTQLSYNWERNQLMLDGKQWITWDSSTQTGGMWRKLRVDAQNEYVPRPVTNYLFANYQTLKSYLVKDKPRSSVAPNTQEFQDKQAAKIATLILETNWERLKEQYNYETAAANGIAYGTVFKKSYWDTSSKNLVKIPKMQIVPVTDPMTGEMIGQTEQPEVDPITGQPVFEELPLGELNTCIIEPQRMAIDPLAMHLHDARWIMDYSIWTLDNLKEVYSREGDGFTGLADEVEEDKKLNSALRSWYNLRLSSGVRTSSSLGDQAGVNNTMLDNCAVVKQLYEAPTSKNPKGRLFVVAGDKVVYAGESPYEGPDQGDWHPYSEFRWEIVPGRFWGKSSLDDAVEIQKQINSIDSAIILTRKTSALPQKLIPMNVGVEAGSWTGRPSQDIFYRNDGTGAKPEVIPGRGPDASVFQERAQRVEDLREIMGSIDILKGDAPTSVNAASALSLLYEVGTGRLYPILDRWKKFVEDDQKKQLKIISKFYKEPRPDFIRMLLSKNKDLDSVSLNNFIGSDLYDNCNVIVEAGSNIPKLLAAKQAMLMQLAQMQALNLSNPKNLAKFHIDLGISGYDEEIAPDTKRAEWENDLIDNLLHSPMNKPVVLAIDNHEIHIDSHTRRMKSPQFMSLDPQIQQAYMQHVQQHEQFQSMAAQAQMLSQTAMRPPQGASSPAGPSAPQPQNPGHATGHGAGVPQNVKNAAMGSDIMNPSNIATRK